MNNTIWKYQFELADTVRLDLPFGCEILDIQVSPRQNGTGSSSTAPGPGLYGGRTKFDLWALANRDEERIYTKIFHIYGTGQDCSRQTMDYIKTVRDGPLVWHIFR